MHIQYYYRQLRAESGDITPSDTVQNELSDLSIDIDAVSAMLDNTTFTLVQPQNPSSQNDHDENQDRGENSQVWPYSLQLEECIAVWGKLVKRHI